MADTQKKWEDPRGFLKQIFDYLSEGVSPSEFKGAYYDIDKLIKKADAKHELAKLFELSIGRDVIGGFRHLDPSDSTVNLVMGLTDRYYRPEGYEGQKISIPDMLYRDAKRRSEKKDWLNILDAAGYLAQKRNQ